MYIICMLYMYVCILCTPTCLGGYGMRSILFYFCCPLTCLCKYEKPPIFLILGPQESHLQPHQSDKTTSTAATFIPSVLTIINVKSKTASSIQILGANHLAQYLKEGEPFHIHL